MNGAPGRTRTCYLKIRNLALYPDELRARRNRGILTDLIVVVDKGFLNAVFRAKDESTFRLQAFRPPFNSLFVRKFGSPLNYFLPFPRLFL